MKQYRRRGHLLVPRRRYGHTYRIYDTWLPGPRRPAAMGFPESRKRFLVVALDHEAHGGVLSPAISLHYSGKNGSVDGYGPKWHRQIDLPKWRWLWWLFKAPR